MLGDPRFVPTHHAIRFAQGVASRRPRGHSGSISLQSRYQSVLAHQLCRARRVERAAGKWIIPRTKRIVERRQNRPTFACCIRAIPLSQMGFCSLSPRSVGTDDRCRCGKLDLNARALSSFCNVVDRPSPKRGIRPIPFTGEVMYREVERRCLHGTRDAPLNGLKNSPVLIFWRGPIGKQYPSIDRGDELPKDKTGQYHVARETEKMRQS